MMPDIPGLPPPTEIELPPEVIEIDECLANIHQQMRTDISSYFKDEQARADYQTLLEYRENLTGGVVLPGAPAEVLTSLQAEVEQHIADKEHLIKTNIRAYDADPEARKTYLGLLALREKLASQFK